MADKIPLPPPIKYTPEERKFLEDLGPDLIRAKRKVKVLKRLGYDMHEAEERLELAIMQQKVLLEEFD